MTDSIHVTGWLLEGALPDGEAQLHPCEADAKNAAEGQWRAEHWPRNKTVEISPGQYAMTLAHIPPPSLVWFPSDDYTDVEVLHAQGRPTGFRVRRIRYALAVLASQDAEHD